jgi:hypothetical protein
MMQSYPAVLHHESQVLLVLNVHRKCLRGIKFIQHLAEYSCGLGVDIFDRCSCQSLIFHFPHDVQIRVC